MKLTGQLVRQIQIRGSRDGPLTPLADQLNQDLTHLQGRRIEDQGQRIEGKLAAVLDWLGLRLGSPLSAGGPVGWPLAEVVTRSRWKCTTPSSPMSRSPTCRYCRYMARAHDADLAEVVTAAAAGTSRIAVLVGRSSTGKTRACWQALDLLRGQEPRWRLWHPIDPSRPDAALGELPAIGPRTVVWLNHDLWAVAALLKELRNAEADEATRTLAARTADHASIDDPAAVAELVGALRDAEAGAAVRALLARDPARHARLHDLWAVAALLKELRNAEADEATRTLAARAADHASIDDPAAVAELVGALRDEAGETDAARALAARAVGHASFDRPQDAAAMLWALGAVLADEAVDALAAQAARHASLSDPFSVVSLLRELRNAEADATAKTLAARAAAEASLDGELAVAGLLLELWGVGDGNAVQTLVSRAANAGMFDLFLNVYPNQASSYPFGREPDKSPSQSWNWHEPPSHLVRTRFNDPRGQRGPDSLI